MRDEKDKMGMRPGDGSATGGCNSDGIQSRQGELRIHFAQGFKIHEPNNLPKYRRIVHDEKNGTPNREDKTPAFQISVLAS